MPYLQIGEMAWAHAISPDQTICTVTWHGLAEELALAFAMGMHVWLGAGAGGAEGEDQGFRV
jgi:hypothetical protein